MPRVIAQMIVRNEADRYLDEVLTHARNFVDEIVITDDASTDNTVEIAKNHTDHVYQNSESMFSVNEGELRQSAWDNLHHHAEAGDLILCMDADEKLFVTDFTLDELAAMPYDVFGITFYQMWNESQFRVDKAWAPMLSCRLFRYMEGGTFSKRKLACGSEPTYVQKLMQRHRFFPQTGLLMQHLGYIRDEDKKAKYDRYMAIDQGEFHSIQHLRSIMDPNPTLKSWTRQLDHTIRRNIKQKATKGTVNGNLYIDRGQRRG